MPGENMYVIKNLTTGKYSAALWDREDVNLKSQDLLIFNNKKEADQICKDIQAGEHCKYKVVKVKNVEAK